MSDETKINDTRSGININDPQSPSYLSASDSRGIIICPIIFTGDNYANWSRLVTNGLKSKNKLPFVDGTLTKPNVDSQNDMPGRDVTPW